MKPLTVQEENIGKTLTAGIVNTLAEKKAKRITVLYTEKITSICSYLIICEGTSSTHIVTLADKVKEKLENSGFPCIHFDGRKDDKWVALDFGQVILHIFDRETREFYDIEKLWRDAENVTGNFSPEF